MIMATSINKREFNINSINIKQINVDFEIALKSANEVKYWLCLFRDALEINKESTKYLINEADEISKIIASSILTMKGKK